MLIKPASSTGSATDLTAVASDVKPTAGSTYNVGSSAKTWLAGYFDLLAGTFAAGHGISFPSNGMLFKSGSGGRGGDFIFADIFSNGMGTITGSGFDLSGNPTGKLTLAATDSSGTPGAVTINKASGRAALASGASSVVVTNSVVTASSIVHAQLETSAAGVGGLVCVPGSGSFTVTSVSGTGVATNTTAIAKFSFVVFN